MTIQVSTLSSKGQITIPKEIREQAGLEEGSRVQWILRPSGQIFLIPKAKRLMDAAGMLGRPGQKRVTLEEMHEGMIKGAVQGAMGYEEEPA